MSFFRNLLMAAGKAEDAFTLTVAIPNAGDTYGFQPVWSTGGYLNIDWGDGTTGAGVTSNTLITHVYASAGNYQIKLRGELTQLKIGANIAAHPTYPYTNMVIGCNYNWAALGSLNSALIMFERCANLTGVVTTLPHGITNASYCFYLSGVVLDFDALAATAPVGGYLITDIAYFISTNKFIGSCVRFLRSLPRLAVNSTPLINSTTAERKVIGDYSDTFDVDITIAANGDSWGFTPTKASAGGWLAVDWGDGSEVLWLDNTFSGVRQAHTYSTAGSYTVRVCGFKMTSVVFDTYDSDNGNNAALGVVS